MMDSPHPFDLIIGLDRSDKKADLYFIDTRTAQRHKQSLDTSPEALHQWLAQLRQQHPQGKLAICLEQPATSLILFLENYSWITLYPINPITLQKFREAFVTSRAKDDGKDAQYLAELLLTHHQKLKPWQPDDSQTRQLQQWVVHRRAVIDERTGLTNRLKALLKQYFPQALELCGEDLWRPLATAFLLKWPTLQCLQKTKKEKLKEFYYLQGSRSQKLIEQRLELLAKAIALTDEIAVLQSHTLRIQLICRQLILLHKTIEEFDRSISAAAILKYHLPDYLRGELSDGGHKASRLEQERDAAVRCSAWLGLPPVASMLRMSALVLHDRDPNSIQTNLSKVNHVWKAPHQ